MQSSIMSCHLDVCQDIYWGRIKEVDVGEHIVAFTDRRPNPNAAQSGSLTSGLSLPFFRYRSGWNSSWFSKTLRSCNIDLKKKLRPHKKRIKWLY